jgi:beta-xylosidase
LQQNEKIIKDFIYCMIVKYLTVIAVAVSVLTLAACPDKADDNNGEKVIVEKPPEMEIGTATNPLLKGDVPDISIVRVGKAYYMVSTTMYFCPVAPIMKSYDLINWKIISYCTDILEDFPAFRLETEDAERIGDYGRGQWASSIRYYKNKFWVLFTNNTTNKTYLFSTKDPEKGPWTRKEFNTQYHDPSLFFDEAENKTYIVYGQGQIRILEMETDLSAVKQGGMDKQIFDQSSIPNLATTEGSQVYKLNGYYYFILITFLSGKRSVLCLRSENIDGPYENKILLSTGLGNRTGGVAQGGIVETPDSDWYGCFFQDRDGVGRVPVLVPMTWSADDWPDFGGANVAIPLQFKINLAKGYEQNLYVSDEFEDANLSLAWQWNHNPDNACWSLSERPGFLRIKTGRTSRTIFHARNTLTQRTFEPACEGIIALEPVNMKDGDIAGLAALGPIAGFAGIEQEDSQKYIVMYTADNDSSTNPSTQGQRASQTKRAQIAFNNDRVYFRLIFQFRTVSSAAETAKFEYSLDGTNWQSIGTTVNIRWTMTHFTGYRFGLFNYAAKEAGGYVDFDYFHVTDGFN